MARAKGTEAPRYEDIAVAEKPLAGATEWDPEPQVPVDELPESPWEHTGRMIDEITHNGWAVRLMKTASAYSGMAWCVEARPKGDFTAAKLMLCYGATPHQATEHAYTLWCKQMEGQ